MLEFTFCFILVILLFAAAFMAFIWVGKNMVAKQRAYADSVSPTWGDPNSVEQWIEFSQSNALRIIPTINRN